MLGTTTPPGLTSTGAQRLRSAHVNPMKTASRIQRRPVPRQTEISSARRTIVMIAMALGAFAIGTTEFTSMGLLPLIADDFGITEDSASVVISVYALGVVVGAPVIAAVTGKLPRRRLIILLIGFLLVGNLLTALAPNYGCLLYTSPSPRD